MTRRHAVPRWRIVARQHTRRHACPAAREELGEEAFCKKRFNSSLLRAQRPYAGTDLGPDE